MAGKKKHSDDAGMSKTAKASSLKKGGKQEGFIPSGELDRVYSLAQGSYVRILSPVDGRSFHLAVGSDRYFEVVSTLGDRVIQELTRKGFPVPQEEAA